VRGNFITDRKGKKNPNYKHGLKDTRLFRVWNNMLSRCYNPNATGYKNYGARGITVCDEWRNDFKAFYDWAMSHGYSDDLTIDRINNDSNYEPTNCRWVDSKTQSTNRSNNHYVTIDGETKTLREWCDYYFINYHTVQDRLKRGWSVEKALLTPVDTRFRRKRVV